MIVMVRKTSIFVILILWLASCHLAIGHGGGGFGSGGATFNVLSFGAKPGKNKESTIPFIRAWNAACNSIMKSTVVIPPGVYKLGDTIFKGPCKSPFPITVVVQGTLQAVSDASAYSGDGWISFDDVNGLVLTGGGTIDGQGQNLWQYDDCKLNPNCVHLPSSIYMNKVTNAEVMSINLINRMGFHMHITNSYLVSIHSLTITAPGVSPNTDGIHVSKSNIVTISSTFIRTGDDCISIGQGSTNVTINQITCGLGHGISVGSLGKQPKELDVEGIIVKNCTLLGTTNGIRIKTYPASDPSRASGMLFQDIIMGSVQNPIIIDQNYGTKSSKPSLVKIDDIVYQNIRGTTISPVAVNLMCSSQVPCQNVRLQNINLQVEGNIAKPASVCVHANVGFSGVGNLLVYKIQRKHEVSRNINE